MFSTGHSPPYGLVWPQPCSANCIWLSTSHHGGGQAGYCACSIEGGECQGAGVASSAEPWRRGAAALRDQGLTRGHF